MSIFKEPFISSWYIYHHYDQQLKGNRIIDTHKEMVIVYDLPKRSGQVYDDWTMM